jgi:hypothetical protein
MLRQELQSYFDRVYPNAQMNPENTMGKQIHIRFELGKGKENGTIERVNQATERALTIFNDAFLNQNNDMFILIYEYQDEVFFGASKDYLYQQFPVDSFKKFYNQLEMFDTSYTTTDENGNHIFEKIEIRIIIRKLPVKDINIRNILNAIANTEMGFEPTIAQSIYFFDTSTDKAFHMYDDRGCFVWSNNADKIRDIYTKRNDWIVDYHRPEIEQYFK